MYKTKIDWIKSELKDKFDFDRIAELLGVPTLSEMDDKYWFQCDTDEERDEAWVKYQQALESVFRKICKEHGLDVGEVKSKPWVRRVTPMVSWSKSAAEIVETINGVGCFYYKGVKDLCDSGPYTERAAVLTHLHWMKRHPEVYGGTSISKMMELAQR